MVSVAVARASNARLTTSLPARLVAVFVGGTGGIGEDTLKAFAQHTSNPRIYIVGRSQKAADRITAECKKLNSGGDYIFLQSDVSLLKNVDRVCQQILAKEQTVNLLFQTQGTMLMEKTSEGLPIPYVLPLTCRVLFALNLLPAIQRATGLKRAVTILAGGFEGKFDENDWVDYGSKHMMGARAHLASMITMANNVMARRAPDVSFIHKYPGFVHTEFGKDLKGALGVARVTWMVLSKAFINYIPHDEVGALQLYAATSAQFPPAKGGAIGVPVSDDVSVTRAKGTDGTLGSGSYSLTSHCDGVSDEVQQHLTKARADGAEEKLWAHLMAEIQKITGQSH